MQKRMQMLAGSTEYPHRTSRSSATLIKASVAAKDQAGKSTSRVGLDSAHMYHQRRTPEEMVEFSRQCEQRVAIAREKAKKAQQRALTLEQERHARSQAAGEAAPAQAAQRLRKRREKHRRAEEAEFESLVVQQESSLEAMNIARMLSPRYQERVDFKPAVAKFSADDERINYLLSSRRIGSYY